MNIKKLRAIARAIKKQPKHYNQGTFGYAGHACGTVACFAGWACFLEDKIDPAKFAITRDYRRGISQRATEILGLSPAQASRLFYGGSEDKRFDRIWTNRGTPKQIAEAAAKRIEHFIKTDGQE
jgi:hypothetical protein